MGTVIEVDYLNTSFDLCELVYAWQPDVLVSQCQRDKIDIASARQYAPDMLCLNWNGDVYRDALVDDLTLNWLRDGNTDIQLVVNATALPVYAQHGLKAAYWQCGFEPTDNLYTIPAENAPDVLFMGSLYGNRRELVQFLSGVPYKVHLVGTGWINYPDLNRGNTTYDFELSTAIRRAAKIEIGDNQWKTDTGFVSNRMFECLAAGGAMMLHEHLPHIQEYTGLIAGKHYIEWTDYDDLRGKLHYYLKRPDKREKIVKAGYDFVHEHCSFDARVKELFDSILQGVL